MVSSQAEQVMIALSQGAELEFTDQFKWICTENGIPREIPSDVIQELIDTGFIQNEKNMFHESIEAIEDGIAENVRLGYMKDNGDGTFSITEAGERRMKSLLKRK